METTFSRRESPCLDALALAFIEARGRIETEFAFSSLQAPGLAIGIASSCGITADSFYVHYDARLVFCACEVAHQHGPRLVSRLAAQALQQECATYADPGALERMAAPYLIPNELLLAIHLLNAAKALMQMICIQRDAQEHLDYTKNLLARGLS